MPARARHISPSSRSISIGRRSRTRQGQGRRRRSEATKRSIFLRMLSWIASFRRNDEPLVLNDGDENCSRRPSSGAYGGMHELNTPRLSWPACWSAPGQGFSRSCPVGARRPCAPGRRGRTGFPVPYATGRESISDTALFPSTRSTSCRAISVVTARLIVDL
jgi:hypothetical protein